jgi:hypothetical protein
MMSVDARGGAESVRDGLGEQPGHKLRAVLRQFEQRLVHQVHVQVAATDVGNESIFGLIAAM